MSPPSSDSDRARGATFATTRWSLVMAVGQEDRTQARVALATLCEAYWYPLYGFVRRQGHDAHTAADLTQGFFARLLERDDLQNMDQDKGRFRAFLLAAMKNYIINQWHRERAQKRGGDKRTFSLDFQTAEGRFQIEPAESQTPEQQFEKQWAQLLLERARAALRQRYVDTGKEKMIDRLQGFLTGDDGSSYKEAGEDLELTENAVKVAVHRMRKRFGDCLRSEIAQTVAEEADIDEEIRYLFYALRN